MTGVLRYSSATKRLHMTATTVTDRIEKTVILKAPRSRIWRAHQRREAVWRVVPGEAGRRVQAGATIHGTITYPGYEGLTLEMAVERIEPERLFSYRWHPGDPQGGLLSAEPMTLVEFTLEDVARRHAPHDRRVGIRQDPAGSPRRGVPDERRRLDRADREHSSAMSRSRSAAAARLHESAPVFAALGDETRLQIVARLCAEGPLSITRLSEGAGVTRQAITKHLNALSAAGLARNVKSGREQIWELEVRRLEMARRCLDRISDQWDIAITRLKALVEDS